MSEEEIRDYIANNLTIEIVSETDFGNSYHVVRLMLEGRCISSDSIYMS
jgi:hypothetical protein